MSIETLLIQFGYAAVLLLMITNGAFSYPSSQLLYIIAGYFISTDTLMFWPVLILGGVGNAIGNQILYEMTRKKGKDVLRYFHFIPERELKKVQILFNQRGSLFLLIGKLIPAVKAIIPIPPGLAAMDRKLFFPIVTLGSFIWALPFLGIGYFLGKNTQTLGVYAVGVIVTTFLFLYVIHRAMNSKKILEKLEEDEPNQ